MLSIDSVERIWKCWYSEACGSPFPQSDFSLSPYHLKDFILDIWDPGWGM